MSKTRIPNDELPTRARAPADERRRPTSIDPPSPSPGADRSPRSSDKTAADLDDRASSGRNDSAASVDPGRRFQTLDSLGAGGMGEVRLAFDRELNRKVAIKVAHNPDLSHRFREEVQILGQLEHPNIVPLHGIGTTADGAPFAVQRYVRGQTLAEVIDDLRRTDPAATALYTRTRLLQIFLQLTQAVGYAHARGVIHRDLKPGNIMLGEHGEVQVLDWGLSKVVDGAPDCPADPAPHTTDRHPSKSTNDDPIAVADSPIQRTDRPVKLDATGPPTTHGQRLGTLAYMPPEQALGRRVEASADIWSLGVILYELLTLERPFPANEPQTLERQILQAEPKPPSAHRSPGSIPIELETVCLQALRKDPGERPATAASFGAVVRGWLEATADHDRRHQLAQSRVEQALAARDRIDDLDARIARLENSRALEAKRYQDWQSIDDKAELYRIDDQLVDARASQVEASSDLFDLLSAALEEEPAHSVARQMLADLHWARFVTAEAQRDEPSMHFYRTLVEQYHDGRYVTALRGDGSLRLSSEPAGAMVTLHPLVEHELQRVDGPGRALGRTPLGPVPLAMQTYVAIVELDGYCPVRYPIHITRNRAWTGHVQLRRPDQIADGFLQIPAGPFVIGGDPQAGNAMALAEARLDDFLIARHPVTMAEYLAFLATLPRPQALARGPRVSHDAPTYLVEIDGELALPERDETDQVWDLRRPVMGISAFDAAAYCAWRSTVDHRRYRLPTEVEWEKAARGVDGRWYPWGDRFDPSLCNMRESRRDRGSTQPVDDFPTDRSVYGVRGMAGNIRDWTSTELAAEAGGEPTRVVRGGAWFIPAKFTRVAQRDWFPPTLVGAFHGFRLAADFGRRHRQPGRARPEGLQAVTGRTPVEPKEES